MRYPTSPELIDQQSPALCSAVLSCGQGDGMANSWEMYSLSYWHNRLWLPDATVSMRHHNCTQRGTLHECAPLHPSKES